MDLVRALLVSHTLFLAIKSFIALLRCNVSQNMLVHLINFTLHGLSTA